MASKSKGKGKNAGPAIAANSNKFSTKEYEGAIDSSYYIKAQKKDGDWCEGRIIQCRLLKEFEGNKKKKTQNSYEYLVHFLRHNRRLDEWLQKDRIELTDQIIVDEPLQKKRKTTVTTNNNDDEDEHDSVDEISQFQKTINFVEIGKYRCETWYYSPFPPQYQNQECLYFCEFCLSFYVTKSELARHIKNCKVTHPPGNEVYRDDSREQSLSMYEIDGAKNQLYCENLGYITKLFLDHKKLYYNLEPFLFFVLCENDEYGSHIVGYFSKQKESEQGWNLNCILTLPCYQRKGYGKFLITFSYELSIIEGKLGTPETPLSDLGKQTYISWWAQRIITYIKSLEEDTPFSIKDIEKNTGIRDKDIIKTLESTQLIKYPYGRAVICTDRQYLDKVYKQVGKPGAPVHVQKIHWVPYFIRQEKSNQTNYPQYDPLKDF